MASHETEELIPLATGNKRWVPSMLFRRKRAEILESFLARPQIYMTGPFHKRYEAAARRNLAQAIAALRGREQGGN